LNAQDFNCGYEDLPLRQANSRQEAQAFCSPNEVYWVNLYYHFVSRDDGSGNFTEEWKEHFNGTPNQTGYDRARAIVEEMNSMLQFNPVPDPLIQKSGVTYPDPYYPTSIRFVLKGVKFIKNTNLYENVTGYGINDLAPFESYRIDPNSAINIFDTNFRNPKPNNCNCYYVGPSGVGYNAKNMIVQKGFKNYKWEAPCSTSVPPNTITCALSAGGCNCNPTIGQQCCKYYKTIPDGHSVAYMAKLTLHEIGHVLNVPHSWSSSTQDLANGNQYKYIGNNFMNYNTDTSIDYGFSLWQINQFQNNLNSEPTLVYDCSPPNCSLPYNGAFLTDLNGNPKTTYSGTKPNWIKVNNYDSFNYDNVRVTVCYLGHYTNNYTENSPCAASYFYDATFQSYDNEIQVYLNNPNWG